MGEDAESDSHLVRGYVVNLTPDSFHAYRRIQDRDRARTPVTLCWSGYFYLEGRNPPLGIYLRHMVEILRIDSPRLKIHVCLSVPCVHDGEEEYVAELPLSNGT